MPRIAKLGLTLGLFAFLAGCGPKLPPSMPLSQMNPEQLEGHEVFEHNCARCHRATSTRSFHGPGLQGLFKLKYLPSGMPANDARVTDVVMNGHGTMKGFAGKLSDEQLKALMAYLHTL